MVCCVGEDHTPHSRDSLMLQLQLRGVINSEQLADKAIVRYLAISWNIFEGLFVRR